MKQSTQVKNRIRAALVESNAAFERLVDFSRPWQLDVLERLGGPWQVLDVGKGSSQSLPTAALSLPSVTATTLRPSRSTIVEM